MLRAIICLVLGLGVGLGLGLGVGWLAYLCSINVEWILIPIVRKYKFHTLAYILFSFGTWYYIFFILPLKCLKSYIYRSGKHF